MQDKNVRTSTCKAILYTLLLAFSLRLIWALLIPVVPVSDSVMYHEFALSISNGNGYAYPDGSLTAYWPVGTSAIYAGLYSLFGQNYEVIAGFNLLIGVLTTFLIILLGQHWFDNKTGLFAGIIYAIWPSQVEYTTVLASELLFNVLVLAGILFWLKRNKSLYLFLIFSGIFFTAASYIRPIALLLPFIIIAVHFFKNYAFKQAIINSLIIGITMAVLISPWAHRNHQLFGETVLISTNGGPVLWMGNNPDSTGEYMPLPDIKFESEVERAHYFKDIAVNHIIDEPMLFIQRAGKRFVDYFRSENIGIAWNEKGLKKAGFENYKFILKLVSSAFWMAVLLLSLYGLYHLLRKHGVWSVITSTAMPALLAYYIALHVIIASGDRYHFPIIPFVAVLAAITCTQVMRTFEKQDTNSG